MVFVVDSAVGAVPVPPGEPRGAVARPAPPAADAELTPRDVENALAALARIDHETRHCIAAWLRCAERLAGASDDGWTIFGVTGLSQLCEERLNLPAPDAWRLRQAAKGCESSPRLAERVQSRQIHLTKAAALASVIEHVQREGDEERLLDFAAAANSYETRDEVARIREEARTHERPATVTLHLTRQGLRDLDRARDLVSGRSGGVRASPSEAAEVALAEFVKRRCPEGRARRAETRVAAPATPPASSETGSSSGSEASRRRGRRIPARERHAVVARHGDVCAVDGCEQRTALQFAHRTPFCDGGANVASNLLLLCRHHHRTIDSGRVLVARDGVTLVARHGDVVGRLRVAEPP